MLLFFGVGLLEPVLACIKSHGNYTVFLASLSTPSRYFYLLGVVSLWVIGKEIVDRVPARMRPVGLAGGDRAAGGVDRAEAGVFLAGRRWLITAGASMRGRIGAGSEHLLVPVNPEWLGDRGQSGSAEAVIGFIGRVVLPCVAGRGR